MSTRTTTRLLAAGTALLATLTMTSGTAVGIIQIFDDVPPSNPFVEEINAIAGSGISTGFPDGTYRPNQNVTRGAMAAFMGRGFGRLASASTDTPVAGTSSFADVITTSVTAGAAGEGAGLIHITGHIDATSSTPGTCPCRVQVQVAIEGTSVGDLAIADIPATAADGGLAAVSIPVSAVVTVNAESHPLIALRARFFDSNALNVAFDGTVQALYVPFTGNGTAPS
jgi:hypothetical protein